MKKIRLIINIIMFSTAIYANAGDFLRGVVYDVGLRYEGTNLSVKDFNPEQVKYDMDVLAHILRCNAVRIEGEDISRLTTATEIAHTAGLKVFFNPWKMGADAKTTAAYMKEAAKSAEKLRQKGIDLIFVAGCEYSLFSIGAFPGETFNERFHWLTSLGEHATSAEDAYAQITKHSAVLNTILADICSSVRSEFNGPVTYSSGTWEQVDWSIFDIVSLDHYRHGESDTEYLAVIERLSGEKPVVVLETGCCTYRGAAARGGEGFSILHGVDAEGHGIYENGITPVRSEQEQADYVEQQVNLLATSKDAAGVFIFVFAYPLYPYCKHGVDLDMTSYALVKTFCDTAPRSHAFPAWEPKEAFFRLGEIYTRLANDQ